MGSPSIAQVLANLSVCFASETYIPTEIIASADSSCRMWIVIADHFSLLFSMCLLHATVTPWTFSACSACKVHITMSHDTSPPLSLSLSASLDHPITRPRPQHSRKFTGFVMNHQIGTDKLKEKRRNDASVRTKMVIIKSNVVSYTRNEETINVIYLLKRSNC